LQANNVREDLKKLQHEVDQDELVMDSDFNARKQVLRELNYIDKDDIPLIKARIAREMDV